MHMHIVRRAAVVLAAGAVIVAAGIPAQAAEPGKNRPRPSRPQAVARPLPQAKVQAMLLAPEQAAAAAGYAGTLSSWEGGAAQCRQESGSVQCDVGWTADAWSAPFPYFTSVDSYADVVRAKAGLATASDHWKADGWTVTGQSADRVEGTLMDQAHDAAFASVQVRKGRNVGGGACTTSPIPADLSALKACASAVANAQAAATTG